MRLLNTTKRKLEEFGDNKIPPYAILSHTWGEKEITFQDIEGDDAEKIVEYEKVRNTCDIAAAHGFNYVWIDTCCVDKTSSAELSETINSMYRWYQDSEVCYAYLADVPQNAIDYQTGSKGLDLSYSRWFARGWTLQELIAPSSVIFLDQKWQEIGTKSSLRWMISEITGIPINILLGGDLEDTSIAQRMSWASNRKTTRVEDLAYCLIGIFSINMPMLYGEGERAFIRLQEEIMKVSDDHSLFAWRSSENHGSLLATSPAAFFNSREIVAFNPFGTLSGVITVNNKGVHLKLHFRAIFQDIGLAILPCTENGNKVAICLKAMSETNEYFIRIMSDRLELLNIKDAGQLGYLEESICIQQKRRIRKNRSSLPRAPADRHEELVKLLLKNGAALEADNIYNTRVSLPWAAGKGSEVVVKLLLENGAKLEAVDDKSGTPLLRAAENGHEAVVKLLLDNGAHVETRSYRTPLSRAAENGYQAVVKLLLEKGAEVEAIDEKNGTPLLRAAENGHEAVVKLLLENGADMETRSYRTPLLRAARNGHKAVVKLLLENNAEVEARDENNQTPLSWAAEKGHEAVVKLLLEKGAEVKVKDIYKRTPLSRAAGNGHKAVVKLLLENSAEVNYRSYRTPISWAAGNGHEVVVKLLLEKGAEVKVKDEIDRTPLSWAAEEGHEAVVKLLLEKGAELKVKDENNQTPLSLAAEKGHEAVVKLLLEKGAEVKVKDKYNRTPLSRAAEKGHEAVVKLLLENGAEVKVKDGYNRTPLSWAKENGHEAVAKILLEQSVKKLK